MCAPTYLKVLLETDGQDLSHGANLDLLRSREILAAQLASQLGSSTALATTSPGRVGRSQSAEAQINRQLTSDAAGSAAWCPKRWNGPLVCWFPALHRRRPDLPSETRNGGGNESELPTPEESRGAPGASGSLLSGQTAHGQHSPTFRRIPPNTLPTSAPSPEQSDSLKSRKLRSHY